MAVAFCHICGASFGHIKSLNAHVKNIHEKINDEKIRCQHCDYEGEKRDYLNHFCVNYFRFLISLISNPDHR